MEWRVINFGKMDICTVLAIHDAVFEAVRDKLVPPTILICRITPSAVSIGRFQGAYDEVNIDKCKELGIDFVRRQTPGGAVFHDSNGEVQYGVIAPEELFPKDMLEAYKLVCGWIIGGLAEIGIKADFAPINDIVVNGKKISGNAQMIKDGVFLQHGTMLYKPDFKTMFSLLKISKEKLSDKDIGSPEDRVTGISSISNVSIDELTSAMLNGLAKGKEYKIAEKFSRSESVRAMNLCTEIYKSESWNFKR